MNHVDLNALTLTMYGILGFPSIYTSINHDKLEYYVDTLPHSDLGVLRRLGQLRLHSSCFGQ